MPHPEQEEACFSSGLQNRISAGSLISSPNPSGYLLSTSEGLQVDPYNGARGNNREQLLSSIYSCFYLRVHV